MKSIHRRPTSDEMDFDVFVESSQAKLQRAAWLLTGDWASAEDLTQEVLLKAWRRWDQLTGMAMRDAYVKRMLATTFLTGRRRRWHNERATEEVADVASEESTEAVDSSLCLAGLVKSLPPRQRTVLVLRYVLDYTEAEVALAMGTSVGTVKSQHAKGLQSLRALSDLPAKRG